ncbi:MAG: ATP-binding protein [Phenylobacterium sp.]|uniref:ATP-binding protein n=1 Tax=Phenylobacterium sp. TaxID=1871053 RepID=UPI0025F4F406|nr:ATP-binding protein [Phenylobacterium sp.]MCA3723551.1 ATP-binding protein [Phenylobacterium sp.]MCA6240468.1 ATP-binding protein [Phenylobacterium sp.]MCA6260445.1 ATP-binding protein [Phenylobacterium sp.]
MADDLFKFAISLSVLNHLGRNLYRNFITVLGEAISNSWDADAKNVWVDIDWEARRFSVVDDGAGMDADAFQNRFLKIGYSKRKDSGNKTERGRPFIGAKGIGKLALLSCARRVTILSKTGSGDAIGGAIDNSGLDAAIQNDLIPEDYPLEAPGADVFNTNFDSSNCGTLIHFEEANVLERVSEDQIRKLLAMNFRFTLIDTDFKIWVNGSQISVGDLKSLAEKTQIIWNIKEFSDDFLASCPSIKRQSQASHTNLKVVGYLATVEKPSNLKVRGAAGDERATVDLFVNGRLREKNLIRHFPTQRIAESYLYGQIHFDDMDGDGDTPFTSSREGVVESNPQYIALCDYMRNELLPQVIDEWDRFRLELGKQGDEENPRKTKRERGASNLVTAAEEDYFARDAPEGVQELVDKWLTELRPDAEFNVSSYVDCFLSENLVRRFISHTGKGLTDRAQRSAADWKQRELGRKNEAGIGFDIRRNSDDLSYLDLDELAHCAEDRNSGNNNPSLHNDARSFRPVRNAVGHTGLLTQVAKNHLNVTFENIRARIKTLLRSVV